MDGQIGLLMQAKNMGALQSPAANIIKVHNGFLIHVTKIADDAVSQIGPQFYQMVAKTKEELIKCIEDIF